MKPRMPDYFFESLPFMLFMIFVVNSGMGVRCQSRVLTPFRVNGAVVYSET